MPVVGTPPYDEVDTTPFCGACGYDQLTTPGGSLGSVFCPACGADIVAFGFTGLIRPGDLEATGGSLEVVFTWTANTEADSSDIEYSINGAAWVLDEDVTSPYTVVAADGEVVAAAVRSVDNGIAGQWSTLASDTATA